MSLKILEPGPLTLVVDGGRPGWRHVGVSPGGAADRAAFAQGNALLGNPPTAAALEFALAGPCVYSASDVTCVVAGAPFAVHIGDRLVPAGVTFHLPAGGMLRIGTTPVGMRGYLCVAGGIDAPALLGSRSGLEPVRRGDVFPCAGRATAGRSLAQPLVSYGSDVICCVDGPQADWFDLDQFFGPEFTVTPASNRMGLRLAGDPLALPGRELLSEPVAPGAVQVVNDGQCIVLGVDGQTIGGYPKVAVVCSADLDAIGQLRPGQKVRFRRLSLAEAEDRAADRDRRLAEILARLAVGI